MHASYKNALMWTLYGVLFLLLAVLQTVVFGRARFFDVLTLCGAVVGYLCDRYLVRRLLSALLMSLLALTFCQTVLFLFQCYLGTIHIGTIYTLPIQIGLSLLACPPVYLGAWAIRKVGAK